MKITHHISLIFLAGSLMLGPIACDDDCPEPDGKGPVPFFNATNDPSEETAASWLEYPFPADHRVTATGAPRFTDFPNPKGVGILDDYIELLESDMTGFSPTSGVYLSFDGAIDPSSLPQIVTESQSTNSAIQLVDITESSPEYGMRRPLRWEYWDEGSEYLVPHTLAAAPAWGMPLRENTTYAFYVTNALTAPGGHAVQSPALLQYLLNDGVAKSCATATTSKDLVDLLKDQFAPLKPILKKASIDPKSVVAATIFTTGDYTSELQSIYEQVQSASAPTITDEWKLFEEEDEEKDGEKGAKEPDGEEEDSSKSTPPADPLPYEARSFKWRPSPATTVEYFVFETSFKSPNYQHGNVPYNDGGGFRFENGEPQIARTETLRAVITVPKEPPATGRCYPIVEYAHGTGGDAYTMVENGSGGRLAGRGIAGISIDQPLHGPRGQGKTFDVNIASFNFANAKAARANFRQSAVDTFSLTRLLKNGITIPPEISPDGEEICFNKDNLGFFGHSQGGLSGSIAMAYEDKIKSWVLSGAGGGLTITILERKDLVNFEDLMAFLLQLDPGEKLSELHPTMLVIQSGIDVTDPIAYAPYWIQRDQYSGNHNIMLTSGQNDEQTPHRTGAALAVAARLPILAPQEIEILEYTLLGMDPVDSPITGNIDGTHTAGFLQWPAFSSSANSHVNHFLIFNSPEAINASMKFLRTTTTRDYPIIERDPDANVR